MQTQYTLIQREWRKGEGEQSPILFIWVNEDGSWEYSLPFFALSIRCLHFPVQLDRKRFFAPPSFSPIGVGRGIHLPP